jgi:hypothetical protein
MDAIGVIDGKANTLPCILIVIIVGIAIIANMHKLFKLELSIAFMIFFNVVVSISTILIIRGMKKHCTF